MISFSLLVLTGFVTSLEGFVFVPKSVRSVASSSFSFSSNSFSVVQAVPHNHEETTKGETDEETVGLSRRDIMFRFATSSSIAAGIVFTPSFPAFAGIDPNALKNLPVEGDNTGAATRMRQIAATKSSPDDLIEKPFISLPGGVSYREYREGKGESEVQPGSKVAVEMTIRMKSFSTNNEPGGVKYYSTKDDTDFNELAWTVGSGVILPGLEEAMMGMHRNGLRRIEIPSTQVFSARNADQLPLPQTKDGKRRFERLFKTDATLLFEVLVTRIK
mmetsp:Transcript_25934/g.36910  ORF Transcript_25934/g.36910 Transcript_25934/m.36910 type:complete len:274 (+) Transcript_25934:421-1242(+)